MDFVTATIICLIIFLLCSLGGYCCRSKREGAIYSTPVVVTSSTHIPAGGYPQTIDSTQGYHVTGYTTTMPMPGSPAMAQNPPYPMSPGMPMPQSVPPSYPPAPGFQPSTTPYPPGPAMANMNPPSYDQVVGAQPYAKQSPYNPNYSG